MGYKRGDIQMAELSDDDMAILARFGDPEALSSLWERFIPLAARVARLFANPTNYHWINADDLAQSVLAEFPKIIKRYKPYHPKQVGIRQYLYFSFYRASQDALRKEDPLGVQIPQKKKYPKWSHLCGIGNTDAFEHDDSQSGYAQIVYDGYDRLDRGYEVNMDG